MNISNVSLFIDQVHGWPIVIVECPPVCAVVILYYGVGNIQILDSLRKVVQITFIIEFGEMVTDHHQTFIRITLIPFPQRGNYMPAINSAECPHIHKHDLPAQIGKSQRSGCVEPGIPGQFRGRPLITIIGFRGRNRGCHRDRARSQHKGVNNQQESFHVSFFLDDILGRKPYKRIAKR